MQVLPTPDRIRSAARAPKSVSIFSPILKFLLAAGVPVGPKGLTTIRGRKSGMPRTTPAAIIEVSGRRWVWAPRGEVNWVRNLRAAGHATITVRRRSEEIGATELDEPQRVAFFRDYLGPLARRTPSVSSSFGSPMVSISMTRSAWPRIAMSSRSTASDVMLPATTDTTESVLRRAIALLAGSGCDPNHGRSHDPTVPGCSFAVVLVVPADPELPSIVLVPAPPRTVEEPVVRHQEFDSATCRRVRLIDDPVLGAKEQPDSGNRRSVPGRC